MTGEAATDYESRIERNERRAKEKAEKKAAKEAQKAAKKESAEPQNQAITIEK